MRQDSLFVELSGIIQKLLEGSVATGAIEKSREVTSLSVTRKTWER